MPIGIRIVEESNPPVIVAERPSQKSLVSGATKTGIIPTTATKVVAHMGRSLFLIANSIIFFVDGLDGFGTMLYRLP